jgi:hypothetical protein
MTLFYAALRITGFVLLLVVGLIAAIILAMTNGCRITR